MVTRRQARGELRRRALLDATLRLIAREGVAGVTHRRIAAEAGVPLAATTYYFRSKTHLLAEAFREHAERRTAAIDEGGGAVEALGSRGGVDSEDAAELFAGYLVGVLRDQTSDLVAEFELQMEASRQPELRALSRRWRDQLCSRLEYFLAKLGSPRPPDDAQLLLRTISGIELAAVSKGFDDAEERRIRAMLGRLLKALLRDDPGTAPGAAE